jgi:pimeloyl-ACP methyl ester carboxylesterase
MAPTRRKQRLPALLVSLLMGLGSMPATAESPAQVHYRTAKAGEVEFFYREAGPADGPVVLLLHGYPTSSHMFRNLIPALSDSYRVIAPDLPGFGSTKAPPRGEFAYTFDNLAKATDAFTQALKLDRYAIYVFDYGAPVGFRLAAAHPERVTAIISQNGNAYEEGLLEAWGPIHTYWRSPTAENRNALRELLTQKTTRWQYLEGVKDTSLVSPDGPIHDQTILDAPGADEIQLDLFGDYKFNVALYPQWQSYFRAHKPPLLAVWGKNDPFFGVKGAEAFKHDIPGAEVHLLDTGHFALETHGAEIATLLRDFLARNVERSGRE